MPREKVTPEEKAMAVKDCAEGRLSQTEAARRLGVAESTVREWVQRYKANGASAFRIREHNAVQFAGYHSPTWHGDQRHFGDDPAPDRAQRQKHGTAGARHTCKRRAGIAE